MTIAASIGTPQSLTFPALPYAKLAPSSFLSTHLSQPNRPIRPSGRTPLQPRIPLIHTGSLTNAHGSAIVRHGDTAIVCGIRGEILRVEDIPDWDGKRDEANLYHHDSESDEEDEEGADADKEEEEEGGVTLNTNGRNDDGTTRQRRRDLRRHRLRNESTLLSRLNILVPNIDFNTGCSPAHLPSGPPTAAAQTLTQRLLTLLHTSNVIRLSDLQIWSSEEGFSTPSASASSSSSASSDDDESSAPDNLPTTKSKRKLKGFWTLYLDILPLSLSGAAFDISWLAILAALRDTVLPEVWWDGDQDIIACREQFPSRKLGQNGGELQSVGAERLRLRSLPIGLSFGLFENEGADPAIAATSRTSEGKDRGKWLLVDLDGFEEGLCAETGTVVVTQGGRLVKIEKNGGGGARLDELRQVVDIAKGWRMQCLKTLQGT